jgi:hypothetical protein
MPTRRLLEVSTSVSWNLIIRIGGICLLHECIDVKILPVKLNEILFGTAQAQNSVTPEVYLPKRKHKRVKHNPCVCGLKLLYHLYWTCYKPLNLV